ncbi:hypothetical protein [Deinococcus sp. NW-56]|uniref:hypothetical protein n=1 Tax=Deinococcus sp. NW-56 TaxID=2080419 RepID=UPI000CF4D687|nr:hypothetical protein [Deinococcus sp. NW-56]
MLHDPGSDLARIQAEARQRLAAYRTPEAERRRLRHRLTSTLGKLEGAPPAQAAFLTRTSLWTLAEALCAVNEHPPPTVTRMWELLPDLPQQPQGDWLGDLLGGPGEVRAFQGVAGWVLTRL